LLDRLMRILVILQQPLHLRFTGFPGLQPLFKLTGEMLEIPSWEVNA
jgi:hypothetical protein